MERPEKSSVMYSLYSYLASDIPLQREVLLFSIDIHAKLQLVRSDVGPNFTLIPSWLDKETKIKI